jgi:hypothetical protein
MIVREPPKLALWLLKQWSSPYQRDSLLGDLNELYCAGRSSVWYWRQVLAALILGRVRALRSVKKTNLGTMLLRLVNALLLAAIVALGFGSITQADTTRMDSRSTHTR